MTIQLTQEKLYNLHLSGMAKALEHQRATPSIQTLVFDDRFAMIVDAEEQEREARRLKRLRKSSHLKFLNASFEGIDYRPDRHLDQQQLQHLFHGDWIRHAQDILITGVTGTGKSWLACALGTQAMRLGYKAQYWRLSNLMDELDIARSDGRLLRLKNQLRRFDVLILDDWGLAPLRPQHRQELHGLIDDRGGTVPTIIAAQLPIDRWYDYIGEPTVADAIMDRLAHSAHRIELQGHSMRKRVSSKSNSKSSELE